MSAEITTYPLNGIDYGAADVAAYESTRTSGVYSAEEDFAVSAAGGTALTVGAGRAWVHPSRFEGYSITKRESETLTLPLADGSRPRIDRIVLRYDAAARKTTLLVISGDPASTPTAPAITRTALQYDLCLAEVTRPAGSTAVTAANIRDTRTDESLCGIMSDGVTGIPTAELTAQWQAALAQQDAAGQACLKDMQARADRIIRNYSGGYVGRYSLTLQPAGWAAASGSTGYSYQYDAPLGDVNTDHVPFASAALGSQTAAAECQMAAVCEALDGAVRFWAKSVPTAAIVLDVTLLGPAAAPAGSTSYDIATDTDVRDMLDHVYNT